MSSKIINQQILDLLRSAMYGSNIKEALMDVEQLGKLLAQKDGVEYDANANRLVQTLKFGIAVDTFGNFLTQTENDSI